MLLSGKFLKCPITKKSSAAAGKTSWSYLTLNHPRDVSVNSRLLLLLSFQPDRERSSEPLPIAGRPGGLRPGQGARQAVRAAAAVPQTEAAVPEGAGAGRDPAGRDPPGHPRVPVPVPQRALELQPGGPAQPAQERYKVVGVWGKNPGLQPPGWAELNLTGSKSQLRARLGHMEGPSRGSWFAAAS